MHTCLQECLIGLSEFQEGTNLENITDLGFDIIIIIKWAQMVINIANIKQKKTPMDSINQSTFIKYLLCVWNYLICYGRNGRTIGNLQGSDYIISDTGYKLKRNLIIEKIHGLFKCIKI